MLLVKAQVHMVVKMSGKYLPCVGALLGAMLCTPVVEWIRDHPGARCP